MKRIQMALTILVVSIVMLTNAEAGDRRVGGVIVGGGTGAIFGQAIGHTAQSTIIGATVGSVAGLLIGNELQRKHERSYHPAQRTVYSENFSNRRFDGQQHQPAYRSFRENCRKIVTTKCGRHQTRRVVTTVCKNDQGQQYRNRYNNRF